MLSIAAAIFFALSVSSSGAMIAEMVFLTTYYVVYKGNFRAIIHGLLAGDSFCYRLRWQFRLFGTSCWTTFIKARLTALVAFLRGFTGRFELWQQAIECVLGAIRSLAYGFRRPTGGAGGAYGGIHSGYLRLFAETGLRRISDDRRNRQLKLYVVFASRCNIGHYCLARSLALMLWRPYA